ncbi:hypothetical protein B0H14DRAFT_3488770 [Mycena olivaceomarginata]|nr:hypothetical protein B0H14DRAFT_3488770 [Mycena olivaceomarginata]
MAVIRGHLGYDKPNWNALRTFIRDTILAARLKWHSDWKAQNKKKLGDVYELVAEEFPEVRRFEGLWAIDRIAQQTWGNRISYKSCVTNPNTYRGRRAAQRGPARVRANSRSNDTTSCVPPTSHAHQDREDEALAMRT